LSCFVTEARPRTAARSKYLFEAGDQNSPNAVTKEKAAEIAADFMTTFYHVQVGALETQEFRTQPVPFWLVCFSDTVKGLKLMATLFEGKKETNGSVQLTASIKTDRDLREDRDGRKSGRQETAGTTHR
jgi:hypothetical protein